MLNFADAKLDLATAHIMIVQDKPSEQDVLAQMLMGFGATAIQRSPGAEEAMQSLSREEFDIAFVDARLSGDTDGYAMISAIRQHPLEFLKHLPIILLCGHVRRSHVLKARDCGANFVLTKPMSARVLFDRIVWMARENRQFVECDSYCGPDRRFKAFGPPAGTQGRRNDDLSEHVGVATEANMSQDAVDGFFGAKKVSL